MANNPVLTATTSVMAPPPIDLDWKHLILEIGAFLGFDSVTLWIGGGLITFFLIRKTITKTVLEGHGELAKYTTIAILASSNRSVSNIKTPCMVHLLHENFSEDIKKLCAQMLLVVGKSAKLLEYEETWATTVNAVICFLLSCTLWIVLKLVSPSNGNTTYLILLLAWAPTGFLAFFSWQWEELRRSGTKLAKKLNHHATTLNVTKKK